MSERVGGVVDKLIAERFEKVITKGRALQTTEAYDSDIWGKLPNGEHFGAWRSQSLALLETVFSPSHAYAKDFRAATDYKSDKLHYAMLSHVESGMGTLGAAAEDHANGHTWTLREHVHADVFDDFLEMAESLLNGGYVTAAAVIAGTTLEEHLRKLCQKHRVAANKKASVINDALVKQAIYPLGEGRLTQGWLDIRNDCAHNLSTQYDKVQIQQMIEGIGRVHSPPSSLKVGQTKSVPAGDTGLLV